MDFTFSEQQTSFRDAVSRFLMTEAAPEMLREIWETDAGRSPQLRAKIAAQGITGLSVPVKFGGLGCDDVDWSAIACTLYRKAIEKLLKSYKSGGNPAGKPNLRTGSTIA